MQSKHTAIYGFVFVISILFSNLALAQSADDIVGVWLTENGKSKVEIYKKSDAKYYAKIIWLKDPKREDGTVKLDDKNPNPKLRTKPIVGLEILSGLVFDDDEWEDGEIYDPESGKVYSCYLEFEGDKLKLRGYIGFSMIGRTSYWTKVE